MAAAYMQQEDIIVDASSPLLTEQRKRAVSEETCCFGNNKGVWTFHGNPFSRGSVESLRANPEIPYQAEKNPRATWAVGVILLSKDPGENIMRDTLWSRLMKMPRFRSKMVVSRFGGSFVELSKDELLHLRDSGYLWSEVLTDGNATIDDLNHVVNECSNWEYDRLKPLWRTQYCRKMADGSAALICTINHGIGDGVSLVATLLSLQDGGLTAESAAPKKADHRKSSTRPGKPGPKLGPVTKASAFGYGVFHGLTSSKWKPDPKNALCMPDVTRPSKEKRVAQTERIPLDEMKAVKSRFPGATLNDIMMAVMTATIRSYLEEVNDPAVKNNSLVRGAFPINLRSPHEPVLRNGDPMNKWAYGTFRFDFTYQNRIDLVWRVKRQVDKIKVSPSPVIQARLAGVLTKTLPRKVLLDQLLNMANLTTAQLSNVPGPAQMIQIAGADVTDISFYLFTPVGLYFGIMSYNGWVSASVNLDGSTGVDPKQLAKHWKVEFDALKAECEALGEGKTAPVPKYGL